MTIWRTQPVTDEPVIALHSWWVFAVPSPTGEDVDHHFNGYSGGVSSSMFGGGGEGRVSSKIVEFNQEKMLGTTRSGRKYQLIGPPGYNGDAQYVYRRWLGINNVTEDDVNDATGDYLTEDQKNDIREGR
jgi:hypothetical protein